MQCNSEETHPLLNDKHGGIKRQLNLSIDESLLDIETTTLESNIAQLEQRGKRYLGVFGLQVKVALFCVLLSVLFLVVNVSSYVILPVYTSVMLQAGSHQYSIILTSSFWAATVYILVFLGFKRFIDRSAQVKPETSFLAVAIAGVSEAMGELLIVYASDPSRTPAYLQVVLTTFNIPCTVLFRFIFLGKGVSRKRLGCVIVVLIGLFITVEPHIWGLDETSPAGRSEPQATASRILWPMCFASGAVLEVIPIVIAEREMKGGMGGWLNFLMWMHIAKFCTTIAVFWSDLIPGFGMSHSLEKFWKHLTIGLCCQYGIKDCGATAMAWLSNLFIAASMALTIVLIKYTDGAVYVQIVAALSIPLSTIFWSLFTPQPHFKWQPSFTQTTGFTLVGLSIMTPAIVLYNLFSYQEDNFQK